MKIIVRPPLTFSIWKSVVTEIPIKITSENSEDANAANPYTREYPVFFYERGFYFPPEPTIVFFAIIGGLTYFLWRWRRKKTRHLKAKIRREMDELEEAAEVVELEAVEDE